MQVTIYTQTTCPFCIRAKGILDELEIPYTEHVMDGKNAELKGLKLEYGHSTVPIILLDGKYIGGCDELEDLEAAGKLKRPAS